MSRHTISTLAAELAAQWGTEPIAARQIVRSYAKVFGAGQGGVLDKVSPHTVLTAAQADQIRAAYAEAEESP